MATLDRLIDSFVLHLRGRHLAPKTVKTYRRSAKGLADWLASQSITDASLVTRELVTGYMEHICTTGGRDGTGRTPAGVSVDYRALQQFFKWADEIEEEITPNPMARMKPPIVPEPETRVLRAEEWKKLLKVCDGREFMSRRDKAIISLFLDTGMRLAELAGLKTDEIVVADREAYVMGKGRRPRIVPFSHTTATAVDRYLRAREGHTRAHLDALWLGERGGAMTNDGIDQVVRRRGREAGIPDLHAHMLRHTWAHNAKGIIPDDEMMKLAGWKSRQMLTRYAASTAEERARDSGKRHALLDRA